MEMIFRLRELARRDIEKARTRASSLKVREIPSNLIRQFSVTNRGIHYTVFRLSLFGFCDCKGFTYRQAACKHIAATIDAACARCAKPGASLCRTCEVETAPYLKESSKKKTETIGNIRI